VTLDGQQLGPDARWRGRPASEQIAPGIYGYHVAIPAQSAALVSVEMNT